MQILKKTFRFLKEKMRLIGPLIATLLCLSIATLLDVQKIDNPKSVSNHSPLLIFEEELPLNIEWPDMTEEICKITDEEWRVLFAQFDKPTKYRSYAEIS